MRKLHLNNPQNLTIEDLNKIKRETPYKLRCRVQAVILVMKGRQAKQIAEYLDISKQTIRKYVAYFNEGGVKKLLHVSKKPGRPPRLTNEQKEEVKEVLKQPPSEVGFSTHTTWNCKTLAAYIHDTYGVKYTSDGVWRMLLKMDFRYNRPTYVLAKADPEKQKAFQDELEELKKNLTECEILLYVDASHIRDYQGLQRAWFPKGEQKKIKTYGHHAKVTLYGALNYYTGKVFCVNYDKINAEKFKDFLKKLVSHFLKDDISKIYIVLDNARVHHAKLLKDFLDEHKDHLFLKFLPPYSPNLNCIEELWKWLKNTAIYNRFHKNASEIQKSVDSFLEEIKCCSEDVKKRLCV
ncbi:Transposase and inactivated derivatives-like protein [Desulfofarcimen acetoxidans DSM 771]|uniref:Transposase and inactivated derivatives-like protein n=1 Tax=Desulfofarcimen acetoxidans (strain ATCC 49208 / DSM 771 / KCTC 5769 / VKM B-1644 / 5575) TaxID=485916 RepID=C8VXM3_DESAS|nr:Transposase and inactivated derivatives-like protein [Desulfofarcimen acetoxidans DSM 771]